MEQGSDAPKEVKVCIVGAQGVGKSNILLRFVSNKFKHGSEVTLGCAVTSKSINVDGETIKLKLWDTVGQEKYRSIVQNFYRGAAAVIFVYDISLMDSFKYMKSLVDEVKRFEPNAILAVAGNKCDKREQREVSKEAGRQYAEEINAIFSETSAKMSLNIDELFTEIGKALPQEFKRRPKPQLLSKDSYETEPRKERPKCCK